MASTEPLFDCGCQSVFRGDPLPLGGASYLFSLVGLSKPAHDLVNNAHR